LELPAQLEVDPWPAMRSELRRMLGNATYEIWLGPLRVAGWDGSTLTLTGPPEICNWVTRRYGRLLERCASGLAGRALAVNLDPCAQQRDGRPKGAGPRPAPAGAQRREPAPRMLNPRYSFEQFIIGEGNRLAHAAALSVAELPGQAYNPLFLYAPPGLGKTHLLHAIGNYIGACGDGTLVRYTTAEDFTNHFLYALGSRQLDAFKAEYRGVDVLLIDDIQFLTSKARTEEEFFHTFNALYESGRQLVLTCDRLPHQLEGIEQRLRERFEAGLVADIKPPDLTTRIAILRKRAALDGLALATPGIIEQIARHVTENIRTLEGALIRVVAYQSLTGRPIDQDLVSTVLHSLYPAPAALADRALAGGGGAPSLGRVMEVVAAHYEISVEKMVSPTRTARVAWARQVAMHLAREATGASLPAIGQSFGGRNHTTVLHACRRVSQRLSDEPGLAGELAELSRRLAGR
jgi:chromosomal replication initiator protein